MSAFKQFTTKDVTITPFDAQKGFVFIGVEMTASDVGIEVYYGVNPTSSLFVSQSSTPTGFVYTQNTTGVYNSIKQLYYTNYLTSSKGDLGVTQSIVPGVTREDDRFVGPINAPRFDNYLQSTLTQSRFFPTGSGDGLSVISIPAKLFGENIVPFTFEVTYTSSLGNGFNIVDDGEGNLIINSLSGSIIANYGVGVYGASEYSGTGSGYDVDDIVGQVFYSHGIAVFTTGSLATIGSEMATSLTNLDNLDIRFSSSIRIYEHQYKCTINENEFQYSQNKTLLSGSLDDVYYDYVTGSFFTPYISTVGLYNENNELLVVGKLSNPIPISQYTDTTIVINFDT